MNAPVTHIHPHAIIRRELLLPRMGKVFVRSGQMVGAKDVLAEVNLEPEFQMLDISRILHVPKAKTDKIIQCWKDDKLTAGDLIAGPVGVAKRVVRAKRDCRVILSGEGQVLIEIIKQPYQLKAGMPGEVIRLIPDRGAAIETHGALVQAVWGNGLIEYGPLTVLAKDGAQQLTASILSQSLRGAIILSGYCSEVATLMKVEELQLRGLILGSMEADLLPTALKLSLPLVLIEGFGKLPINPIAYNLLRSYNGHDVALNAYSWDPYFGKRPEIVIPIPATDEATLLQETLQFAPDQTVRLMRAPYLGQIGVITKLAGKIVFPSGLRDEGAEIKLDSGKMMLVPLANLEVIA